jgi:hypothetical protein
MTLSPATTAASRKPAACRVSVPRETRSSSVEARTTNFLMLMLQCRRVISGIAQLELVVAGQKEDVDRWAVCGPSAQT